MTEVIDEILGKVPLHSKENLIPVLQEIQEKTGYFSPESLLLVSNHLNIPLNRIYGVATFFDQFRFKPKGVFHIQICNGTACHICQPHDLLNEIFKILSIKPGQTSRDGKFSLEVVSCLGACNKAAVMRINENYHSKIKIEDLHKLLTSL